MKELIKSVIIFIAFYLDLSYAENKTQKRTTLRRMIEFEGNINIGALVSLNTEDPYFERGRQMSYAYDMFVDWVNTERSGVTVNGKRYSVSIDYVTDFSSSTYVIEGTNFLTRNNSGEIIADFMLGPYTYNLFKECSAITESKEILLVSGSASERPENHNLTFSVGPDDINQLDATFQALSHWGAKTMGVLRLPTFDRCDEGEIRSKGDQYGINISGFYYIDDKSNYAVDNVTSILSEFKMNGVETVLTCAFDNLCIQVTTIAEAIDYNANALIFSICFGQTGVLDVLGASADYVYFGAPWAPLSSIKDERMNITAAEWSDMYAERYLEYPSYQTAGAFTSAEVLLEAIEQSQSFDPYTVADTLSNTYFSTIYENITFSSAFGGHSSVFSSGVSGLIQQYQYDDKRFEVVFPSNRKQMDPVYPVPSWKARGCIRSTDSCAGHGQCFDSGVCTCIDNYYGKLNSESCDTYCDGEIVDSLCRENTAFYVGVVLLYGNPVSKELLSHIKFTAQLINNNSDGFLDPHLRQVTLVIRANDSQCNPDVSYPLVLDQQTWAKDMKNCTEEYCLDGLIGDSCSYSSMAIAVHDEMVLPQISHSSTSDLLSSAETYPYFSRICSSDSREVLLLVELMESFSQHLAMVETTTEYALQFSDLVRNEWQTKKQYSILANVVVDGNETDYSKIVDDLASSGSPLILLITSISEAEQIFSLAQNHPVLGSSEVMWFTMNLIAGIPANFSAYPTGMIGLGPYKTLSNPIAQQYVDLWEQADPNEFYDLDGDRSIINPYGGYIVDSLVALSLAYQNMIDGDESYETEADMRADVFQRLSKDIQFYGFSGPVDFTAEGEQVYDRFEILNFQRHDSFEGWEEVGYASQVFSVNTTLIQFPDGNFKSTSVSYTNQLRPYCNPGHYPTLNSDDVLVCSPCNVGYYKPDYGSDECRACPEGTDCNDVGIIIPCILKNYWRSSLALNDMGDFNLYPAFRCYIEDACLGGCVLNNSCAFDREPLSPACGVCGDNYYLSADGSTCVPCLKVQNVAYFASTTTVASFVFLALLRFVFTKSIPQGHLIDVVAVESTFEENQSFRKKFARNIPKFIVTGKLLASYVQVVSGGIYAMQAPWPSNVQNYFHTMQNIMAPFDDVINSNECSTTDFYPYYFKVLFFLFSPLVLWSAVIVTAYSVYFFNVLRTPYCANDQWVNECYVKLRNLVIKFILWTCLVMYSKLSATMTSYYNCRNFGIVGTFMESDHSIDCETDTYVSYSVLAGFGIILYPVGIPMLFTYVIKHRFTGIFKEPSTLLHKNFELDFAYFEAYDLIRKFFLTTLVLFISEPGNASRAAFLLFIDIIALVLLAFFCPYKFRTDDMLSFSLVVNECLLFFLAILVITDTINEDNYRKGVLFTFFVIITTSVLFIILPISMILKFDRPIQILQKKFGITIFNEDMLSRESAAVQLSEEKKSMLSKPSHHHTNRHRSSRLSAIDVDREGNIRSVDEVVVKDVHQKNKQKNENFTSSVEMTEVIGTHSEHMVSNPMSSLSVLEVQSEEL